MRKIVLSLANISRSYGANDGGAGIGANPILDDISYDFYSGQMVALTAPSGAGKSSLLHIAGLLEMPDSGRVIIDGQDCSILSNKERSLIRLHKLGFIYQLHHLLSEFSASENVMLPLLIKGYDKASARYQAEKILDRLCLGDKYHHKPRQLSGGEQQRVAIARAVIHRPLLLLADEPTGNLDPSTSRDVFNLLQSLVKELNICALIATHDHALAQQMDKILTFSDAKLLECGQLL